MEAPKEKHQTLDPTENVDLPSDGTKIAEAEKLSDKENVDLPKVSEGVSRVAPQFCIYCGQTLKDSANFCISCGRPIRAGSFSNQGKESPLPRRSKTMSAMHPPILLPLDAHPPPIPTGPKPRPLSQSMNSVDEPVSPPMENKPARPPRPTRPTAPPVSRSATMRLPVMDRANKDLTQIDQEILEREWLTKLYLFQNRITAVPPEIGRLQALTVLDLSYNRLTALPPEICELKMLEELLLVGCRVVLFPPGMDQMESLKKIDLTSNKMPVLSREISFVPNLEVLDVSRNKLTYLPLDIENLKKLKDFNVSENDIHRLPKRFYLMSALTKLNLFHNHLLELPEDIGLMVNLQEVNLGHNHLRSLPPSFSKLNKLTLLDLSDNELESFSALGDTEPTPLTTALTTLKLTTNKITKLPNGLWSCTSLQTLDVSKNRIEEIPESLGKLVNLGQLNLGANKIKTLPNSIDKLIYLETLNVFSNSITHFPTGITALSALKFLYAGYNQINSLPLTDNPKLAEWEALEVFFISSNPLKTLPKAIGNLTNLQEFYAGNCQLTEIPPTIKALKNLQTLDFGGNKLTTLPKEISALQDLVRLDLSNNNFSELPEDMFEEWQIIEEVNLEYNNFKAIPERLAYLCNLNTEVYLNHNPLNKLEGQKVEPSQESSRYLVTWSEMTGRRPKQEDCLLLKGKYLGSEKLDLFGVFDGHAGQQAARYCVNLFPKTLEGRLIHANPMISDPVCALRDTFADVNEDFRDVVAKLTDPLAKHCGTTALVMLVQSRTIYLANLGDTRAVLSRKGEAIRLSVDHKPMTEEHRINALGGWITGSSSEIRRVNGNLAVARSIGDYYMEPFVNAEPYVDEFDLVEDDEFVILACDGVWDVVDDQEAVNLVRSEQDGNIAARKLRDFAYLYGSDDNISVCVVYFHKKPHSEK